MQRIFKGKAYFYNIFDLVTSMEMEAAKMFLKVTFSKS